MCPSSTRVGCVDVPDIPTLIWWGWSFQKECSNKYFEIKLTEWSSFSTWYKFHSKFNPSKSTYCLPFPLKVFWLGWNKLTMPPNERWSWGSFPIVIHDWAEIGCSLGDVYRLNGHIFISLQVETPRASTEENNNLPALLPRSEIFKNFKT